MTRTAVLLALPLLLAAGARDMAAAEEPPEPRITVEIATGPWHVGDLIPVRLQLELPPDPAAPEPRFPAWGDAWGEAEVVRVDAPQRSAAGDWVQDLVLRAFRPGTIDLPPLEFGLPGPDRSLLLRGPRGARLEIASVLPAGATDGEPPAPQPPAGLRHLPWGTRFWIVLAGGVVLVAGLLVLARRRPVAAPARAAAPPVDPRFALETELAALTGVAAADAHAGVSRALRRYLERRLGVGALSSTTRRLRRQLDTQGLPRSTSRVLLALLADCDAVRFARRPPADPPERLPVRAREAADALDAALQAAVPQANDPEVTAA